MIGRGSFTALSAAAAVTLGACGGSNSTDNVPAKPPVPPAAAQAKPEHVRQSTNFSAKFEARVDAKCKRAEDEIKAIGKKGDPLDRLRRIRDVFEGIATDFEQTKAPPANKRAWKRYRTLFRDGADWVGRIETEVADGDRAAFNRLQAGVDQLDRRTKAVSTRYGFAECADD